MSAKDGLKLIVVIGAQLCGHIFSWLLHNMGLNCMGELIHRLFFNQYCLTYGWLTLDAEPGIQRTNYKFLIKFLVGWGFAALIPTLFKDQLY